MIRQQERGDFSEEGIARGRPEATANSVGNLRFEVKDVPTMDERAAYDLICTFDAVHD